MGAFLTAFAPAVLNGALGMLQNRANVQATRDAQAQANAFAERMMHEAYDMNSPSRQVQEFERAGMNPNLITGSSFVGATAPQNQGLPNYSQQSPWNLPTDDVSAIAQKRAGARLANEQALSEKALRGGNVRLQNAQYDYTVSNTALNKRNADYISKQMFNIDETIQEIRTRRRLFEQQIEGQRKQNALLGEQVEGQKLQNFFYPRITARQIDRLISQTANDYASVNFLRANANLLVQNAVGVELQNSFYRQTWDERKHNLRVQNALQGAHLKLIQGQDGMLRFQFGQLKDFDSLERWLRVGNSAVQFMQGIQSLNPIDKQLERAGKVGNLLSPYGDLSPSPSSSGGLPNASTSYTWY